MNTKTLSSRALSVIDQYLHFKVGAAVCNIPYFNNKSVRTRAGLRVNIGKGSPADILDEAHVLLVKAHVSADSLTNGSLKKLLSDENIGVDCSAFAYYVLNAESEEIKKGPLDKHVDFVNCRGLLGKVRCSLRPIENCDVATLSDDKNSRVVPLYEIQPGDFISMMDGGSERDHILVIYQVDYQNFVPIGFGYSHAVAYPEDGVYGSGPRQGRIEIVKPGGPLLEQKWIEDGMEDLANRIFVMAQKSKTEVRRLKWF